VVLLSHPTGNANSRQLALALAEAGWLKSVVTGFAVGPHPADSLPGWRLLPQRLQREFLRRSWPASVASRLQPHPLPDLLHSTLIRSSFFRGSGFRRRLADWHYLWHDRHVANHHLCHGLGAVIAVEDAATETLLAARRRGSYTILELPTLHHETVARWHRQEAERNPQFLDMLTEVQVQDWKIKRKKHALEAADLILVPSQLVSKSCLDAGIPFEKLRVIPYGASTPSEPAVELQNELRDPNKPVVLYVGQVTPAKGIHDLVSAWQKLPTTDPWNRAELWLVGQMYYPREWQESLPPSVRYFGVLPFQELEHFYRRAWMFVLPSLVDGMSLVCLEAMSFGLAVLITERCGVQDLITPGVNGWITPAAQPEALLELLKNLLANLPICRSAGVEARLTARAHSWEDYRHQVRTTLAPFLES
jgi:alpha-maltose-1-phosphate synthase